MQPRTKLTLDQPTTYQIEVPGHVDERWSDWIDGMTVTVKCKNDASPISTLTCEVDQAALQGLLRRLYALGLPLISVKHIDDLPNK